MSTNCDIPLYAQTNIDSVESCYINSGYRSCFIYSIVILIVFLFLLFWVGPALYPSNSGQTDKEKKRRETYNICLYFIFAIILICLWIFGPKFIVNSAKSKWNSIQEQKKIYKNSGLSDDGIMNILAQNYNTEKIAESLKYSNRNRNSPPWSRNRN